MNKKEGDEFEMFFCALVILGAIVSEIQKNWDRILNKLGEILMPIFLTIIKIAVALLIAWLACAFLIHIYKTVTSWLKKMEVDVAASLTLAKEARSRVEYTKSDCQWLQSRYKQQMEMIEELQKFTGFTEYKKKLEAQKKAAEAAKSVAETKVKEEEEETEPEYMEMDALVDENERGERY